MTSFDRLYTISVSFIADILNSLPKNPSWGLIPKSVYIKAISELKIVDFTSDDKNVIIKTYDGMVFTGPKTKSEFLCSKRSLDRSKKYLKQVLPNISETSDAHAALVNNLVNRYVTEFSSYPYKGIRTLNLRSGDTFVDIGAFRGYVACKAAQKVGKEGAVIAIEPIQENIAYIDQHIQLNSLSNIEVINAALSTNEKETIEFYRSKNQQNSEIPDHIKPDSEKIILNNISVKALSDKILSRKPDRVIISLTTNGTELQLLEEFIKYLGSKLEYCEIIVPIIYTHNEAIDWAKRNQSIDKLINVNYPWLSVITTNK